MGHAPLTLSVTLALRCSPELAAPVGVAGALGVPQGTFGHPCHGLRCNLCFERCRQRTAMACCPDTLCLAFWPHENIPSLPSTLLVSWPPLEGASGVGEALAFFMSAHSASSFCSHSQFCINIVYPACGLRLILTSCSEILF